MEGNSKVKIREKKLRFRKDIDKIYVFFTDKAIYGTYYYLIFLVLHIENNVVQLNTVLRSTYFLVHLKFFPERFVKETFSLLPPRSILSIALQSPSSLLTFFHCEIFESYSKCYF